MYVGQAYDVHWTYNAICPSFSQYLKMVDKKTGSLFRFLIRLMLAESPFRCALPHEELIHICSLFGRAFQIRDDYANLSSKEYHEQKGFAEDLDDGKYSFMLIHCIQTLNSDPKLSTDAALLRALLMSGVREGHNSETKKEVIRLLEKTKSFDYTREVLKKLYGRIEEEVKALETRFHEPNPALRSLVEQLKV